RVGHERSQRVACRIGVLALEAQATRIPVMDVHGDERENALRVRDVAAAVVPELDRAGEPRRSLREVARWPRVETARQRTAELELGDHRRGRRVTTRACAARTRRS